VHAIAQHNDPLATSSADELPPDEFDPADDPPEPSELEPTPIEPSDLEAPDIPCSDDDSAWEVFIPDEDQRDPLPDPSDFWIDTNQAHEIESLEPE